MCRSVLAQLVEARYTRDDRWHVERRCPECGWQGSTLVPAAAFACFEREQDAARDSLLHLLAAMQAPTGGPRPGT